MSGVPAVFLMFISGESSVGCTELKDHTVYFPVSRSKNMSSFFFGRKEGINFSLLFSRTHHQGQTEGERKGERTSAGEGKEKRKG